jgi:hypothetical protein
LPALDEKRPGSVEALARSLDVLVSSLDRSELLDRFIGDASLDLGDLLTLSDQQKRQVLAAYMRSQGLKNYGLSHINEIIKRLDSEQKHHTFRVAGRCWKVDAGRMTLESQH